MESDARAGRSYDGSLENLPGYYCWGGQKVILAGIIHLSAPQLGRECDTFLVHELSSLR